MSVRRATPEDAEAVADVQVRTWLDAYTAFVDREKLLAKAVGRDEVWRRRIADGVEVLLAVEGEIVVGIASAADAWIQMLYVAPEAQGRGHGSALLDGCLASLRRAGATEATLWVFERNAPARAFYERRGFGHDGSPAESDEWAAKLRYRKPLR